MAPPTAKRNIDCTAGASAGEQDDPHQGIYPTVKEWPFAEDAGPFGRVLICGR